MSDCPFSNWCCDSVFVLADSTVFSFTQQLSQVTCQEHVIGFLFYLTGCCEAEGTQEKVLLLLLSPVLSCVVALFVKNSVTH